MTNHWIDIKNADVILIMGSNAAENHPVSFYWVSRARESGATLIHVDPRFTRTSAQADIHASLRSGTDIAFLGGMIKYILDNDLYQEDYVRLYTNASFLVNPDFQLPGELDGLFSGFDEAQGVYDREAWAFERDPSGIVKKDRQMRHPRCVLQLLKKHFSRYDPDTVASITGTPRDILLRIYAVYAASGQKDKAATIMYAMGWTQHSVGTQNIRTMAIIQLLLGNIGLAGGGVNALRGESNVQGSTDHCLLYHILPGYLKTPRASQHSLEAYLQANTPASEEAGSANWWSHYPQYAVSLLKAFFGDNADPANAFGYVWLPKLEDGQDASWLVLVEKMYTGHFQGLFAWGQNPACSGANSNKTRQALAKLEWLVNVNLFDNETGSFWRGPGMDPASIKTEVFLLPCSSFVEKQGSITNSGRWAQWRYRAIPPKGESRPDAEIINELQTRVRQLYEQESGVYPDPICKLAWDCAGAHGQDGSEQVNTSLVSREINGYFLKDVRIKGQDFKKGALVPSFASLQDDGSTSSGNWLYCGSFTENGNMMARRSREDPSGIGLYPEWAWCWPVNRRILYNRASVDARGRPWDPEHPVIQWKNGQWIGDIPDGGWPPMQQADGTWNPQTRKAFIMKPDGVASLFGPGRRDGPFPEHYEPLESPLSRNPLPGNNRRINPLLTRYSQEMERRGGLESWANADPRFPYVCTTYRVTEHWQTGVMTRHTPWLLEIVPQVFMEMSRELAHAKKIRNGDIVTVQSARGKMWALAVVTNRFQPLTIMNRTVHQVGVVWHFGWQFPENGSGGDSANILTSAIGCPNTGIPETKAFMVNVVPA